MYPALTITWLRGHDPELEVWNCSQRSDAPAPGDVVQKIDLSPYSTVELHQLVQCKGMEPSPQAGKEAPAVARDAALCAGLGGAAAAKVPWYRSVLNHALPFVGLLLLGVFMWYCCRSLRSPRSSGLGRLRGKAKEEDVGDVEMS